MFQELDTIKGHFTHKKVRTLFREMFERVRKEVFKKNKNKGFRVNEAMISEYHLKTLPYYQEDLEDGLNDGESE